MNNLSNRQLGKSSLYVAPVALGTWPIAGITTQDVNNEDSIATIRACADLGINFVDTAYCYGRNGESETLIRQAISDRRDQFVLATKCGIHYNRQGQQTNDARPETILRECDESLRRLGTDRIELYYLHSPDPEVPIAESASAISELINQGKVLYAGASNCQLEQLQEFHTTCALTAVQLPYNMLQRDIEQHIVPWCREQQIAVVVYWALMKGLLAGRLTSEDQLAPEDSRRNYPMFQGDQFNKNLAFVEQLRQIAADCQHTVAQVVVNWTIQQPGITACLCGAKRPWQIQETAAAMEWQLSPSQMESINSAIKERGPSAAKRRFC